MAYHCVCSVCTQDSPNGVYLKDARTFKIHAEFRYSTSAVPAQAPQPQGPLPIPLGASATRLRKLRGTFDETRLQLVRGIQANKPAGERILPSDAILKRLSQEVQEVPVGDNAVLANLRSALLHDIQRATGQDLPNNKDASKRSSKRRIILCGNSGAPGSTADTPTAASALLACVSHVHFNHSTDYCGFLLKYLKLQLQKSGVLGGDASNHPVDLRTALDLFELHTNLVKYICCPVCFSLYKQDACPDDCTAVSLGLVCGAALFRTPKGGEPGPRKPHKVFWYQSPIEWLGELLQRPGIEEMMDAPRSQEARNPMVDIWDGSFARKVKDSKEKWFFRKAGRYMFAVGIDGFDPHGRRGSHKQASVVGIWMSVNNLPIHIRNQVGNICFLGLIPGRTEPLAAAGHMNNLLRPAVDDFLVLYNPGVRYSSTPLHPTGKNVNAVVGPLLNDLKSARVVGGFCSTAHTLMCSRCGATKHAVGDPEVLKFPKFTYEEHHAAMLAWLHASSALERKQIETQTGSRFTELARLPYYRGPDQTVHEGLHGVMNVLSRHLDRFFGIKVDANDVIEDGVRRDRKGRKMPSKQAYLLAEKTLLTGSTKALASLRDGALEALAFARGMRTGGVNKPELLEMLNQWRIQEGIVNPDLSLRRRVATATVALLPPNPDIDISVGERLLCVLHCSYKRLHHEYRDLLVEMCRVRGLPQGGTKHDLVNRLISWRESTSPLSDAADKIIGWEKLHREGVVLGRAMLQRYRDICQRTTLPSFVKPPPERLGQVGHGRITASEWNTICLISMVFLLVPLWSTEDRTSRKWLMLENLMHLVSAIRILTQDTVTKEQITVFQLHYTTYLRSAQSLFRSEWLAPNNHMMLHDPDFLELWGPLREWSSWYMEFLNGVAQDIKTNWKFGERELEGTFMKKLCLKAKLEAFVSDNRLPEDLVPFARLISTSAYGLASPSDGGSTIDPSGSGCIIHLEKSKALKTDSDDVLALKRAGVKLGASDQVRVIKGIEKAGRTFRRQKGPSGDGLMLYTKAGRTYAGEVRALLGIFTSEAEGRTLSRALALVDPYEALPEKLASLDPFRAFTGVGGYLVRAKLQRSPDPVLPSAIVGHFARCKYTSLQLGKNNPEPYFAVLPLENFSTFNN